MSDAAGPRTLGLVACASAAVLAHEVALVRALSIAHWHHAANLIVAAALAGFAAAGTAVAVWPRLRTLRAAHTAAAAYAVAAPVSLWAASRVEFNALAVGWEAGQWARLALLQAVFVAPMVLGALAILVPLALARRDVGRIYAVNLVASGAGAIGVLPLLGLGPPEQAVTWVALLAAAGAALRRPVLGGAAAVVVLLLPAAALEMTAYKPLVMALDLPDARVIETRHRPTGRIDVVAAPALRLVEGLSLVSPREVAPQRLVFVDGLPAGALLDGPADHFEHTLAAAPLSFLDPGSVLVLGSAGDLEERYFGAQRVRRIDPTWTGENPRALLAAGEVDADLTLLRLGDSVALAENGLATEEAFRQLLRATRGALVVTVPVATPPREELKVIRTARRATPHVVVLRALDQVAVVMTGEPLSQEHTARLHAHCRSLGFDVIGEGGTVHRGGEEEYAAALRGEEGSALYRTAPATDLNPYFHRFQRWSRLGDDLARARGLGAAHVDWGTLVAVAGAVQMTLIAVLLAGVPLLFHGRVEGPRGERRFALLHFTAIGLAFALVETAFLGRLTISLGSPEVATGGVVAAFLVGSGIGSARGRSARAAAPWAAGLAVLGLAAVEVLSPTSLWLAVPLCLIVAIPMGVPFPAGLRRLDANAPGVVPWALAVNGCASVAAFAAAPVIASDVGSGGLVVAGAALYLLVALGGPSPQR